MSAPRTYLVRSGISPTVTADDQLVPGERGPEIWAHVQRVGFLHVEWEITAGPTGEPRAWGTTLTKWGADLEAKAAAHRPGIGKAAAK